MGVETANEVGGYMQVIGMQRVGSGVCLCCLLMRIRENGNEVVGCKSSLYGAGKGGSQQGPMEASKKEKCVSPWLPGGGVRRVGAKEDFLFDAQNTECAKKNNRACHSFIRSFIHSFIESFICKTHTHTHTHTHTYAHTQ
jgi:hypothetical protein